MANTLHPNYTYEVSEKDNVQTAVLTEVDTGKTKTFTMVNKSLTGLSNLMSSYTQDIGEQIFGKRKK